MSEKNIKKSTKDKKVIQVLLNVPIDLNNKFKKLAEQQGVPKSYMFITALNYYLDHKDSIKLMPEILNQMSKIVLSEHKRGIY